MPAALKDKVAIVTGASRGIGAAIARRFAAEGARVVITARTLEAGGKLPGSLTETAAQIEALGGECLCVQANLADPAERARIIPAACERYGGIDILVNNAATARYRSILEQSPRHVRTAFEINLFAPLELAQQAVPLMRARSAGWILNISSMTAHSPAPAPYDRGERYFQFHLEGGPTLYATTKAAIDRLSTGMAAELADTGIAINALAPVEAVATEGAMMLGVIDPSRDRVEPVEAMAEAALLLCSGPPQRLSGRIAMSLPLLREFGVAVRTLDGRAPLPGFSL